MMKDALILALERYPVFSIMDIASVLNTSKAYAYLVAFRLKKAGKIYEIENGKYTLEKDPMAIASWIIWPSYISCWAALNYYKLTEQLPFTLQVVTSRKRKHKKITFNSTPIEFIQLKKQACNGFKRILYQGKEIFIAEKEKALVDGLAAKKMSFTEAVEIIQNNKKRLNAKRLLQYAKTVKGLSQKLRNALK